ncbi:MAG: right-handed parallel beta-helix repeat-containing protein [Pirellulales bacterium]
MVRNCSFLSAALLIVVVTSAAATARDWFVNNRGGDDAFSGQIERTGTLDGPVRTIARALRLAGKGDRIVLANSGEPYRESVSLVGGPHSGLPGHPFVFEGNGATLDGRTTIPPEDWQSYGGPVFRFSPRRLAYQQLYLNNVPAVRHPTPRGGALPRLAPLEWYLDGGYLYFRIEEERMIDDYALSCAAETVGITAYKVHDVVIQNLTIQGFQLDGIQVHDSYECLIGGVTSRGNGRTGVAVVGASRATVDQCVLGDNAEAQLLVEYPARVKVFESDLLPKTAPAIVNRDGEVEVDGQRLEQ